MDSAEGFSEDGSHRPSNIAFHSMFHHDRRRRYAVALRVTAKLKESNLIDQRGRAALKELILDDDSRVFAAVETFFSDSDVRKVRSSVLFVAHPPPPLPLPPPPLLPLPLVFLQTPTSRTHTHTQLMSTFTTLLAH